MSKLITPSLAVSEDFFVYLSKFFTTRGASLFIKVFYHNMLLGVRVQIAQYTKQICHRLLSERYSKMRDKDFSQNIILLKSARFQRKIVEVVGISAESTMHPPFHLVQSTVASKRSLSNFDDNSCLKQ